MSSQVYYRKWRPQSFAELVGQEHVTRTLLNALASGRVAHAYLFSGPRGTGKTSMGRLLAKAVNCLENGQGEPCNTCAMCQAISQGRALDLVEIDAASNRGIDEIRELREKVNFAPNEARYKVYIIDEVHMLTEFAFNALLKTLEEPPPHAIFVLATTEVHKVPATILSRCQHFDFRRLSLSAVVKRLQQVCEGEGLETEPGVLELVARSATGSLRDAENLLEQMEAYYGSRIELSQAQALLGISGDSRSWELMKQILRKEIGTGLTTLGSVVDDGLDLRQFHRELLDHLRALLLVNVGAATQVDLTEELLDGLAELAQGVSLGEISRALQLLGSLDLRSDATGSLPLEMALVAYALGEEGDAATSTSVPVAEPAPRKPSEPTARETTPSTVATFDKEQPGQPHLPADSIESQPKVAPPQASSLSSGQALSFLSDQWKAVIDASRQQGKNNIDALLRSSCRPVAVEDNIVVLGFYYSFHKEKVEEPENQRMVEGILSQVLGAPYRLRCVLVPKELREPQPNEYRETTLPPKQSPLVRAAQEMGARIVEDEED